MKRKIIGFKRLLIYADLIKGNQMTRHLSKSQYLTGRKCHKALWYMHNLKDLRSDAEGNFDTGREVGEFANIAPRF